MRKYVLICNNRRKKILYYYDFRDECVYCIDGGETSKNAEKGARKGGYYGGIIGIFLYPVLGKASYHLPSGMLACISVISIAANKVNGIRAAVCSDTATARLVKQHNNANIIAFGERIVGVELAKDIVKAYLTAEFEGGRHAKRVAMISDIEARN